jgi:hypothetical protein
VEASVVAVLIVSTIVVVAIAASLIGTAALLYAYRRLEPQQLIAVRVATLGAMVENLEQQVRQLRTKKAGKASAEKKGYQQEADGSPELDGLNEEERALFM